MNEEGLSGLQEPVHCGAGIVAGSGSEVPGNISALSSERGVPDIVVVGGIGFGGGSHVYNRLKRITHHAPIIDGGAERDGLCA